jgi:hypothetical protein
MILGHRGVNGCSINLTAARVDETTSPGTSSRLEQVERSRGVHLMVGMRLVERMANTPTGQMENDLNICHHLVDQSSVEDRAMLELEVDALNVLPSSRAEIVDN